MKNKILKWLKPDLSKMLAGCMALSMLLGSVSGAAFVADAQVTESNKNFYVSLEGNDDNPGTKSKPFKTISRAKEAVAEVNDDMTSDIVVYLMDGVYYQDETLKFTEEDSGTNGYKVRYEAYEEANVEISGGKELEGGWKLYDAAENIYSIEVPESVNFRQLYVNDKKAVRARTGKDRVFDSSSRILGADRLDENGNVIPEWWNNWSDPTKVQAAGGRVIVADDGRISPEMDNLQEVELHIFTAWSENILRVQSLKRLESYDCRAEAGHTGKEINWEGACWQVTIQSPEAERIFNRAHPGLDNYLGGPHYAFYYENAYEYIDEDMEWYLDTQKNRLYFKAPEDMDMGKASAVIPMLDEVLCVEGTLDAPAHDIEFNGLTIEHSTWLTPCEEGKVGGQACQDVTYSVFADNNVGVKREGAGVRIENARNVRLDGNTIRFMGATGVLLASGTESVTLINNVIEETAGNGIEAGKFSADENTDYHIAYNPSDERELCRDDRILNNEIHAIGTQYEGAVGIGAGYVQGMIIANNTIYDCPYCGISVGYGWTSNENPMNNNRIFRNEVYHVNQIVCDGGAIYTLSNQAPDSYITENYLHDNLLPADADYGAGGIYLDEQTSGYTVRDNVLVSTYGIIEHVTGPNNMGDNPIYWGASSESGYADFVTDRIRSIMDNAGVQENFDESEIAKPEVEMAGYDPYYQCMNIDGMEFGRNAGSIIFETKSGEIKVSGEDIKQWSNTAIRVAVPKRAKAGDKVFVVTREGKKSAGTVIESKENGKTLIVSEDFEDKTEGASLSSEWEISNPEKAQIVSSGEGKYLQLKGNSPDLEVTRKGTDGKLLTFGNNITQFDFQFTEAMSDYTGMYNKLCTEVDFNRVNRVDIRPAFETRLSLEQMTVGETRLTEKEFLAGEWYTCRTMVYDNMLYLSVFKTGDKNPDKWELKRAVDRNAEIESILNFSFYDPNARTVKIDNITVEAISQVEEAADTSDFEEAVKKAESCLEEEYTENSLEALKKILADAKTLLETDLSENKQDTVDEMTEKLLEAMSGLKKKMPFVDVSEGDWFYDGVYYNYFAETMTGKDETHFAPLENLARAQFAVIIHRMQDEPKMEYTAKFPDVAEKIWYTDAILWAAGTGVVTGYSDTGFFGPADNINREQMAVMMYRYAKYLKYDVSKTADFDQFEDAADVNEFAKEAMKWAVGNGIITGKYEGTKIDPQGNALRGECALIIQRFMEKYEK